MHWTLHGLQHSELPRPDGLALLACKGQLDLQPATHTRLRGHTTCRRVCADATRCRPSSRQARARARERTSSAAP